MVFWWLWTPVTSKIQTERPTDVQPNSSHQRWWRRRRQWRQRWPSSPFSCCLLTAIRRRGEFDAAKEKGKTKRGDRELGRWPLFLLWPEVVIFVFLWQKHTCLFTERIRVDAYQAHPEKDTQIRYILITLRVRASRYLYNPRKYPSIDFDREYIWITIVHWGYEWMERWMRI